jgi:two-component system response regulator HydG
MFASKNKKEIKAFTPKAMDSLLRYDWPGNVRELMNAVERGVVLAQSEYLDDTDLRIFYEGSQQNSGPVMISHETPRPLEEVEKETVLKTLESAGGNKSETARRLGITRKTLHKKLKKYGVMP